MYARVLVKITPRYLTLESTTVSVIVPVYRDICIISLRTCVVVQHIDQASKMQGTRSIMGLALLNNSREREQTGILVREVEAVGRISGFSYLIN